MDGEGGTGLPASFEAAWGLRERPAKGPKPGLSLERIVDAAVKIAVSDGLAAVSMSRVATDLGVSTMSLYRYVSAKDELLALMMDAPLVSPPDLPLPGEDWRAGLHRWAWAELGALRQHPWVLRIPLSAPPATPGQIAWLEQGLRCLRGTGLAEREKVSVIILLSAFVWRWATVSTDLAQTSLPPGVGAPTPGSTYAVMMAKVADAQRFPALHEAIAGGAFDDAKGGLDADFVFGLERILDGVEALIRTRE